MLVPVFFVQNFLAVLVILGLILFRSSTRSQAVCSILAAWCLMIGVVLAGVWYYPSPLLKWLYLMLLAVVSIRHFRRLQENQTSLIRRFRYSIILLSSGIGGTLIWQMLIGYFPVNGDYLDISRPFDDSGRYCVMSGGSTLAHNFHYTLANNQATRYEMHAIDFTKINPAGLRTKQFSVLDPQPRDPGDYLIFGTNVVAPCTGEVIELQTNKTDHLAGQQFRDATGANYVTLQCSDALVSLVHLQKNSVTVEVGQKVTIGDLLGRVGNSGNSEEPHLHIHANSIANEKGLFEPIPLRINGRYLARGECL